MCSSHLRIVNSAVETFMDNQGSLSGIKVLDLSRLLPGPYCSMILADHGAEVIAVEDRRFKEDDLFFNSINRNKRHISLNLKSAEGKEIFFKLAEKSDVMLEGFRPGVVKRLGVDYETIKKINPSIVYCSITGYGQDGPLHDRAGHDVNYMATAGLLGLIGPESGLPSIPGVQFADIAGGSMNGVVGILLALYARTVSGKGQYIDISMTDGLLGYLSLPHFFSQKSGRNPCRGNDLLSHRYGCYNTYGTADGKCIVIGAVENRFWANLCGILGMEEYVDRQYDEHYRTEIIERLRKCFRGKTVDEWNEILADQEVCYSAVLEYPDVLNSELFRERELIVDRRKNDGTIIPELGIAVKLSETPGSIRTEPVSFGADTATVLGELGYSEEQIEDYARRDVT